MDLVLILGLAMTAVTLTFAGRRVLFLGRLITSGQPAPDRLENVTKRLGESLKNVDRRGLNLAFNAHGIPTIDTVAVAILPA